MPSASHFTRPNHSKALVSSFLRAAVPTMPTAKLQRSDLGLAHRLHSSSFLGLPSGIVKNEPCKGTTMEPMGGSTVIDELGLQLALKLRLTARLLARNRTRNLVLTYSLHCSSFWGGYLVLPHRMLIIYLVEPKKGTTMETIGRFLLRQVQVHRLKGSA